MTFDCSYFFDFSQFSHAALFQDDLSPWEVLLKIHDYLIHQPLGNLKGIISPSAYLVHPERISIGEGSIVEPGALIQGPCIIEIAKTNFGSQKEKSIKTMKLINF